MSSASPRPRADRHSSLTPFLTERAVSCLSQPKSRGAKMTWNLTKIWEGRMKLKSYSRVQAFFCYFNPVIEAMCSCWFLNLILFWKGQTASLDALSGYRAPKSGELPAKVQTSSANWGDMGIWNQRSSLKGLVPMWNDGEHREGCPWRGCRGMGKQQAHWPWRGHVNIGRWILALIIIWGCGMWMWTSLSQLTCFFPFSLVDLHFADPKLPGK